jgi:anti-sigma-K factor RskA
MSAHIANEVPRLLTGEATRDEVMTAAAHLRTCVDCQQELVSAMVAHASLTSAQRFAPEVVSGVPYDLFAERGGSELATDDVEIEPHFSEVNDVDADETAVARSEPELPDLSAVFAQVRKEATESRRPAAAPRHASRARYLVAAAAAVVVLGGGTAVYLATSGSDSPSHTTAGRTFKLAAYDKGTTPATASIAPGGKLHIDAASLPKLSGKGYEVWLTNDGRTRMQPVGWISPDGQAAMTVPENLLSKYSDLEVSVQDMNAADYAYSGESVLRGYYE